MRRIVALGLMNLMFFTAYSQTTAISGKVSDAQGKPVPFAFVKDAAKNYATYTNADGMFGLTASPAARLLVTAPGYKPATISADNPQNVNVTLQSDGGTAPVVVYPAGSFKESVSTEGMTRNQGSQYIAAEKGLHGSRYLFAGWVHGYAITTDDSIKQDNNYRFNYAKMDGTLLYTGNGRAIRQLEGSQIKMFALYDDGGQALTFESVPVIDPKHFVQVLAAGNKYKIYKQVLTRFKAANYSSNGMTSTGTTYDEFLDENNYFVIKAGGQPQKIYLKKKSIKAAFAADADKVNKYLSANDGDIDDNYLIQLGEELNK